MAHELLDYVIQQVCRDTFETSLQKDFWKIPKPNESIKYFSLRFQLAIPLNCVWLFQLGCDGLFYAFSEKGRSS